MWYWRPRKGTTNLDPFNTPELRWNPAQGPFERQSPRSRRQVDFAPRPHSGGASVGEPGFPGLLEGEDVLNTPIDAGAGRQNRADGAVCLAGHRRGRAGFAQPASPLDFGNSGTGCRLVMGAVAGCPITAVFDGDASLRSRPMRRILDPLELMGRQAGESKEAAACR